MENIAFSDSSDVQLIKQGAEAKIYKCTFLGRQTVIKERFSKSYRHPTLDKSLTIRRIKAEIRCMTRCRINGIRTPVIYFVDMEGSKIYMEYLDNSITVKDHIRTQSTHNGDMSRLLPLAEKIGRTLGLMHRENIVHGDLTTSNILLSGDVNNLDLVLIDFGLGFTEGTIEDKAVDLYVLERALLSTHPNTESLFEAMLNSYGSLFKKGSAVVMQKLEEVRLRGRKRTMVG